MQKIISYYQFVPIKDPASLRLWQQTLAKRHNLVGRIIIAEHGINGTLGGELKDVKAYVKATKEYPAFKSMAFKWSDGEKGSFPRLSVKIRAEIVTFGVADQIKVNQKGIVGTGQHLKPHQVHELLKSRGEEVVFFDGRNAYEAEVGRFKKAVVPDVRHTRDFPKELKQAKYNDIKDKPIITYCTNGVRCEVLSMLMKQNGFKEVYQIDGGIFNYGEEYKDDGLWQGSLYVFDGRLTTRFSPQAKDIGSCSLCGKATANFINCSIKSCNDLILVCTHCQATNQTCRMHVGEASPTA